MTAQVRLPVRVFEFLLLLQNVALKLKHKIPNTAMPVSAVHAILSLALIAPFLLPGNVFLPMMTLC